MIQFAWWLRDRFSQQTKIRFSFYNYEIMPRGSSNTEQEKQFDMFHSTEKCQFFREAAMMNNLYHQECIAGRKKH